MVLSMQLLQHNLHRSHLCSRGCLVLSTFWARAKPVASTQQFNSRNLWAATNRVLRNRYRDSDRTSDIGGLPRISLAQEIRDVRKNRSLRFVEEDQSDFTTRQTFLNGKRIVDFDAIWQSLNVSWKNATAEGLAVRDYQ